MNWERVVQALEEWRDTYRQAAAVKEDPRERSRYHVVADLAFLLGDCLRRGLDHEDLLRGLDPKNVPRATAAHSIPCPVCGATTVCNCTVM